MKDLIIVVGAGPGIGLATARRFGQEGFAVGLIARREDALQARAAELAGEGMTVLHRAADAADGPALAAALESLQAEAGVPAVVLYNAAHLRWRALLEETAESLTADFRVNVAGALTTARAVLPGMTAAGRGLLLFTGSLFDREPSPAFGALSVGKAGLRNLAEGLARSLKESPVRVRYLAIQGRVSPGDPVRGPAAVAERCWQLHAAPAAGGVEVIL